MLQDKYNRLIIDKLPKEVAVEFEQIKTDTENFSDTELIDIYKDNFNALFLIVEDKYPEALKAKKKLVKPAKAKVVKSAEPKKKLVKKEDKKKVLKSSGGSGRGFGDYEKGSKITEKDVFELKKGDVILSESDKDENGKVIKNAFVVVKEATKDKPKVELNYVAEPKSKENIVWWANIMGASNFYFTKEQKGKKIGLDKITILWAEGDNSKYDKFPKDYKSWTAANDALIPVYNDNNKDGIDGGYNKTKFKVIFKDGEDYEGRLDISKSEDNPTETHNVVGQHIKDFLDYQLSEKSQTSEKSKAEIKEWLEKYDLGLDKKEAKKADETPCDEAIETLEEIENKKAAAAQKRAEAPKKKAATAAREKQISTIKSALKTNALKNNPTEAKEFLNDLVAVYKKHNFAPAFISALQEDIDAILKGKKVEKMAKGGIIQEGDKVTITTSSLGKEYKGMSGEITDRKLLNDKYSIKLENGMEMAFSKDEFKHNSINPRYNDGGQLKGEGVDLFEDYENIPENVQGILDEYSEAFEDGDYKELEKANKELKEIGYTFEYDLDGQAYDLRKIGQKGKSEE